MVDRLPPLVRGLGAVSLLNDLASEMMYPLLPALLTRGLGAGAFALGALDGVADAVAAGVKVAAGWLADRPGWRKPLVLWGYAAAAVTRPVMGWAGTAWQVVALRAADRVGKGARTPPRDALIADAVDPAWRGRAFGFHRAMDHAGAMVGPLVATGLIAGLAFTPRDVILWSAVPGLLAVGVAVWVLRGATRGDEGRRATKRDAGDDAPEPAATPPGGLVALVLLFAFLRLPEALLLLRLQDVGVPLALVPLLWAALHVVRSAASYPGGWVADRAGPARTMLLGWGIYALACAGMAAADGPAGAALWFLLFGLVAATTEAPERALVAAWGGRRARGRGFGLYHAGLGFAALPGGLALGGLYQAQGAPVALGLSAAAALGLVLAGLWAGRPGGAARATARRPEPWS
jgi:MFS family permease